MSSERSHELARPPFPDLDGVVEPGRGDPPAVGGEGDVVDLLLVACEAGEGFLRRGAGREGGGCLVGPEKERVVVGTGDQRFGVRGDQVLVPRESERLG